MITVRRDSSDHSRHIVTVRDHSLVTDISVAEGGEDDGPDPHDLYDAALGACKALTILWYARRKAIPVEDIEVVVARDASQERQGVYTLRTVVALGGDLSAGQREELRAVAAKCPVHKLMTEVTTEVETLLSDVSL
jgi:putative redox protein